MFSFFFEEYLNIEHPTRLWIKWNIFMFCRWQNIPFFKSYLQEKIFRFSINCLNTDTTSTYSMIVMCTIHKEELLSNFNWLLEIVSPLSDENKPKKKGNIRRIRADRCILLHQQHTFLFSIWVKGRHIQWNCSILFHSNPRKKMVFFSTVFHFFMTFLCFYHKEYWI